MNQYVALLQHDSTGGYGVAFPDFPGCVSAGDSFSEAVRQAAMALRFHVEAMLKDGDDIPEPHSAEELKAAKPDWFEDAVVALVPLLPPRTGAARLNVSLDGSLVREIDRAAKLLQMTRSAFLAIGAQRLLEDVNVVSAYKVAKRTVLRNPATGAAVKRSRHSAK